MSNTDRWQRLGASQIRTNANWIKHHLTGLETGVTNLNCRQNYTTDAEAALEEAEDALVDALSRLRALQREYRAKPVYRKPVDHELRETCRLLSLDAAE